MKPMESIPGVVLTEQGEKQLLRRAITYALTDLESVGSSPEEVEQIFGLFRFHLSTLTPEPEEVPKTFQEFKQLDAMPTEPEVPEEDVEIPEAAVESATMALHTYEKEQQEDVPDRAMLAGKLADEMGQKLMRSRALFRLMNDPDNFDFETGEPRS